MKRARLWTLLLAAAVCLPATVPAGEIDAARAVERAIERAADKVSPAVVNIIVTREPGGTDTEHLDGLPDELREFFDRMRPDPGGPFRWQGNGSGVLIASDGVILTSEHVVRDASEIEVTLADRRRFKAKVVGADPRRDLAVIRVDADGLPSARLGDADTLRRGQFVLALGSPFGFGRDGQASLSFGIVSGTGRAIPGIGAELDRYYGNLIQTDAAVNPGNSGGPLVDLDGRIVGVNAVISSQTGVSEGVGFAVPITRATRRIIDRLRKGEEVVYGFIGIEITEIGQETAAETGAEVGRGAYVVRALPDGPGAKAGLEQSDVILAVNGQPVQGPDDVIQMVQVTPVGEKVALTVLRDGKRREVKVEVARRPSPGQMLASRFRVTPQWRGMKVEPLTDELREQIGLSEKAEGVFVREVRDSSPAADAGIAPGMVIDQVGETKVTSVRTFQNATRDQTGKAMVHVAGIGVKVIPAPEGEDEEK